MFHLIDRFKGKPSTASSSQNGNSNVDEQTVPAKLNPPIISNSDAESSVTLISGSGASSIDDSISASSINANEENLVGKNRAKLRKKFDDQRIRQFIAVKHDMDGDDLVMMELERNYVLASTTVNDKRLPLVPTEFTSITAAIDNFTAIFESRYGAQHAPFYDGSLQNAIVEAIEKQRPLAIYLHDDNDLIADLFAQYVMSSAAVSNLLERQFVLWAWDVTQHKNRQRLFKWMSNAGLSSMVDSFKLFSQNNYPMLFLLSKECGIARIFVVYDYDYNDISETMLRLLTALDHYRIIGQQEYEEERNWIRQEQQQMEEYQRRQAAELAKQEELRSKRKMELIDEAEKRSSNVLISNNVLNATDTKEITASSANPSQLDYEALLRLLLTPIIDRVLIMLTLLLLLLLLMFSTTSYQPTEPSETRDANRTLMQFLGEFVSFVQFLIGFVWFCFTLGIILFVAICMVIKEGEKREMKRKNDLEEEEWKRNKLEEEEEEKKREEAKEEGRRRKEEEITEERKRNEDEKKRKEEKEEERKKREEAERKWDKEMEKRRREEAEMKRRVEEWNRQREEETQKWDETERKRKDEEEEEERKREEEGKKLDEEYRTFLSKLSNGHTIVLEGLEDWFDEEYQLILLNMPKGSTRVLDGLKRWYKVADLKASIAEELDIPREQQRLFCNGKWLEDNNYLHTYDIVLHDSMPPAVCLSYDV